MPYWKEEQFHETLYTASLLKAITLQHDVVITAPLPSWLCRAIPGRVSNWNSTSGNLRVAAVGGESTNNFFGPNRQGTECWDSKDPCPCGAKIHLKMRTTNKSLGFINHTALCYLVFPPFSFTTKLYGREVGNGYCMCLEERNRPGGQAHALTHNHLCRSYKTSKTAHDFIHSVGRSSN